jgi:hypothetical protein
VKITTSTSTGRMATDEEVAISEDEPLQINAYPNPASPDELNISIYSPVRDLPVKVQMFDQMGRTIFTIEDNAEKLEQGFRPPLPAATSNGVYVIIANQGERTLRRKVMIRR